jgi:hypothetical protein
MATARSPLLLLVGVVALAATLIAPESASACSCLPADLATVYNKSDAVLRVRILRQHERGRVKVYRAQVLATYKGCLRRGERLSLVTPPHSAACGVALETGGDYLVTGRRRGVGRALDIGLCGFNRPFAALGPDEIEFLDTRFNCCGEQCDCVDSALVQCFVDPCEVASCPGAAICAANYCGGCRAEFFDEGGRAVCRPCATDDDCPLLGQHCGEDGRCRQGCGSQGDCGAMEWCAPTNEGGLECRPHQRAGGTCGGFTLPDDAQQCATGFACEPRSPRLPDIGGTCRRVCFDSSDCPDKQYCGSSALGLAAPGPVQPGVCRRDGSCATVADCDRPGNDYPRVLCVGETTCEQRRCGVQCGVFADGP